MYGLGAANAYARSARHRSLREQEADVFLRVNGVLRGALDSSPLVVSKAVADNSRLWLAVMDSMRDPANKLPRGLRASIMSVGHSVQRESAMREPDIRFLLWINEQLAAGLSGI